MQEKNLASDFLKNTSAFEQIAPMVLVLLGAVPFVASAAMVFRLDSLLGDHSGVGAAMPVLSWRLQAALASLLIYGAVILSFLGGIRWGIEIGRRPDAPNALVLGLSVIGALAAWGLVLAGLMVRTNAQLLWAFAMIYGLHFVWDNVSADLPLWFKRLRLVGTLSAVGSFLAVSVLML